MEEVHPEHELPLPAIGEVSPELFLLKEAKQDKARLAFSLHCGHGVSLSDSLMERNNSNLWSHEGQWYSYMGIFKNTSYFSINNVANSIGKVKFFNNF